MKKYIMLLPFVLFFAACTNNEEEQPGTQPAAKAVINPAALKDSITRYPDSLSFKTELISYYRDSGEYQAAIEIADAALKNDSLNAGLWDIKATLHFEDYDTLNAIGAFEKAVHILPDPKYLMSLGSLYAQTKNAKALLVADVLEKTDNGKAATEAIFIRGLYFSYAGDKLKAVTFFDKCLGLDYHFMPAYLEKAIIFYDQGKCEEAIKILDRAVTLQNNFDEGYYWRGRCLEKLNRPVEAAEEYQNALMYNPDYIEAKEALARLGVK